MKAFHNPLNLEFYDELDYCVLFSSSSPDNPVEHVLLEDSSDLELADYDWMTNATRQLLYKELMNKQTTTHSIGHEYVYEEVSPTETKTTFKKMHHFAYYYVSVRACYNDSDVNGKNFTCSEPTIRLAQTKNDHKADQIENLHTESTEPNSFEVSWTNPQRPNGAFLSFKIQYILIGADMSDAKFACVPYKDIKKYGKKVIKDVTEGNYSVTVAVKSLAGSGQLSHPNFIVVKSESNHTIFFVTLPLVMFVVVLIYYLMTQQRRVQLLKTSTNPLYETFIYIPDDGYELKRDNIVLSEELGAGHFGKVYEGTLKNEENGSEMSVAVKTVRF